MIKIFIIIVIAIVVLFIVIFAVYYSIWSKITFGEYEPKQDRNIHELLILLSEHFELEIKEYSPFVTGLCLQVSMMNDKYSLCSKKVISDFEYEILLRYIYKYRPDKKRTAGYWWPKGEIEPRRKWLKRHIFITKIKLKLNLL